MSRGAKVWLGCGLVLILALGAGYGLDRWTANRTEASLASDLAAATDGENVHADVTGPLFLPQVASGSLDRIEVQADRLTLQDISITDVTATAHDVSVDQPRTVGQLSVTGTLPIDSLQQLLSRSDAVPDDFELSIADGHVAAHVDVFGTPLAATVDPAVRDGEIRLRPRTLQFGDAQVELDDLPTSIQGLLEELSVPVDALPDQLAPAAISVRQDGIRLTVTGNHIDVDELG